MSDRASNVDRVSELTGAICDESASQNDFAELDSTMRRRSQLSLPLPGLLSAPCGAKIRIAGESGNSEATPTDRHRVGRSRPKRVQRCGARDLVCHALRLPRCHVSRHSRLFVFGLVGGVSGGNGDFRRRALDRLFHARVRSAADCQAIRPSAHLPSPRSKSSLSVGSPAWSIASWIESPGPESGVRSSKIRNQKSEIRNPSSPSATSSPWPPA